MDVVFDIIDNINSNSLILITISFAKKYNLSIGRDHNFINIYLYQINKIDVIKYTGRCNGKKYEKIKEYISDIIGNIPIQNISGISSIENKNFLEKNFIINEIDNNLINLNKNFVYFI